MKHVRKQYNRFSFRLSILGTQVDAGESFKTEQEAGVACDLTKHYLRSVFSLDLPASIDPEVFSAAAYRLKVDLSNPISVLRAIPEGVRDFIQNNDIALNAIRESQPERPSWHVLRASPAFYSNPAVAEWVLACERAELNVEAFGALNSKYFLALMEGISGRAGDILKPLALAIKIHSGAVNPLLVERVRLLTELQTNLTATEAYVKFLVQSFADQEDAVKLALHSLSNSRPPLT